MRGKAQARGSMERSHDLIGSWIIVDKATGKAVAELFDKRNVDRINVEKYSVYTAEQWLGSINGKQ